MNSGVVKWFNNTTGFGFALLEDNREVFLHYSQITGQGFKTLKTGDKIQFDLYENEKGLEAKNIVKLT